MTNNYGSTLHLKINLQLPDTEEIGYDTVKNCIIDTRKQAQDYSEAYREVFDEDLEISLTPTIKNTQELMKKIDKLKARDALVYWEEITKQLHIPPLNFNDLKEKPFKHIIKKLDKWTDKNKLSLSTLQKLSLSNLNLSYIPESIRLLVNLKSLILYSNNLNYLPNSLANLTSLETLSLFNNKLNSIPDWIGNLDNLEVLNLAYNNINSLPISIGKLANIRTLRLTQNNISMLPDSIGNLTKLRHFSIAGNNLRYLPFSIRNLKELNEFILNFNPGYLPASDHILQQDGSLFEIDMPIEEKQ